MLAKGAGGSLDPQVNYTLQYWQLYQATQDGLVAFKKAAGTKAFTIVPDLAVAIPKPTDGGKTWTFKLRKGIKYSDGRHGAAARLPLDVPAHLQGAHPDGRRLLQRARRRRQVPQDAGHVRPLQGRRDQQQGQHGHVPPDEAGRRVARQARRAARLRRCPWGTPNKDLGTKLPPAHRRRTCSRSTTRTTSSCSSATRTSSSGRPTRSPTATPTASCRRSASPVEAEVTQIENGQADWTLDFAAGRPPQRDRHEVPRTRCTSTRCSRTGTCPMNVNLPPFNNKLARQAVNYAIDRNAAVRIFGGPKLAVPSLPDAAARASRPTSTTARTRRTRAAASGRAPDLAKAKALVKQSGTAGAEGGHRRRRTTRSTRRWRTYLQSVLNSIGYKATVKPLSSNISFTYIQNTKNKVQIAVTQWYQDYPAPSDFLNVLLGCGSFHPGSDTSINIVGLLQQDGRRRDAEGAAARHRRTRRPRSSCGRRSTSRSRTTPRRPCSSTRA